MALLIPPPLANNAPVSVIAPAGVPVPEKLEAGIAWLKGHLDPIRHQNISSNAGYLAGSDASRAEAFQDALDRRDTRAIIAARGGFGTTRILNRLNLDALVDQPKWVVGSSDLTAVLITLWTEHRMAAIHGPMVAGFSHTDERDLIQLIALLQGRSWQPPTDLLGMSSGTARGPLIGGNLTIIAHLAGTLPASFSDGAILFLEDIAEKPYRLDRCLTQIKRAGILDRVVGILLGEFTECDPGPDGTTWQLVMEQNLSSLNIPVATGYPAAHGKRNAPFVHGATVHLEVSGDRAVLKAQEAIGLFSGAPGRPLGG